MTLTEEQKKILDHGDGFEMTIEGIECVLLSKAQHEQLVNALDDEMDYNPVTVEEMNLLADEAADMIEGDELDEPLEARALSIRE